MKNGLDEQYIDLLKDILENGVKKNTRNGEVLSVFGRTIRYKFKDGKFPLLTTKKIHFKSVVTELLWFLRGDTNIKFLVDNDCHIWDGDCFSYYQKEFKKLHYHTAQMGKEEFINKIKTDDEFAKKWGELGPVYGKQWRSWSKFKEYKDSFEANIVNEDDEYVDISIGTRGTMYEVDQIGKLISELKTNPDSRRLMVNAWNVGELDQMVLPPCHYGFQVYTRELSLNDRVLEFAKRDLDPSEFRRGGNYGTVIPEEKTLEVLNKHNIPTRAISLMWNQRSVDTFLGLPFNIASYGLLLEIIAKEVNMIPDELIGNLGDVHLYTNHIEQAKEQIGREPYPLPKLLFKDHLKSFDTIIDILRVQDFILDNYQSHPTIKAPLSN